ncbi:site-specific recombinase [Hydrogenophaga crocea]|uniref:Site-specific recombinase n=2 Tax=Hydrogenophaga crocea TaxID=2716225 RepID=A0A6G8ILF7_9BURK|nr:site-specific recombinase [Hydrogenophaga crocea]QIM54052.1 site-specific recombinase [Hydrogenophaga crocea]
MPRMDLQQLLDTLAPEAPLAQRHLWLMDALAWVRGDAAEVATSVERVRAFVSALEADPALRERWHRWLRAFIATVDLTPLLADFGFAPRTAFLSEFGHRLRRKLLPGTPETRDLADLFSLLLPSRFDVRWIKALDTTTLQRLGATLPGQAEPVWNDALMDALTCCVSQVSATGFAAEIRIRMSDEARAARPFHELPSTFEALRREVRVHGPRSEEAAQAAERLREQLDACRHAAYSVYHHLEEHGISVGIVFRLRQLRERIVRIKQLLDCLLASESGRANAALLGDLAQVGIENRSLRALIASSSHLTAAKVAERSAESGEHYITRNAAEYKEMLGKAAGGGFIIAFTTWIKFALYGLGLSAFWGGFAAGFNYAACFVLVMLLHWTVATKQPAVTAPAMVAKLKDIKATGAVRRFVDEIAHLFRSQIAAILGNIGMVIPTVLLISALLQFFRGEAIIGPEKAMHVMHDLHLLGPTLFFAAFTGVLLFASSIVAGWVENWFVLHNLDSAIAHNPRFTRVLGRARAARWAAWLRTNMSGLAANISLGFMLGLVPAFAQFFGLGLDVRHVTLSAGQLTAAGFAIGLEVLRMPEFWWAAASVLFIGPLNLTVSFYLAFRLALQAQAVSTTNRQVIGAAIRRRLRAAPLSFLVPPRVPPAASAA